MAAVSGDEELLGAARSGDEAAFAALVARYHGRLVGVARSVLGRRDLAEDVAQDTWMAVLRGLDGFEGRSSFRTWLFRICVHRARSSAAKEHRSIPFDPQEPGVEARWFGPDGAWAAEVQPWTEQSEDKVVAAALVPLVRQAIDSLPDAQRVVVILRDIEGLSSAEVCDVLSITEGNHRVLLHRGRNHVRAALDRHLKGR